MQVGSYVVLKCCSNINEIVATGVVEEVDNVRVNGIELGSQFCQVVVQYVVKKDERLVFPINHIHTVGNALGVPIVWPLSLVCILSWSYVALFLFIWSYLSFLFLFWLNEH